MATGKPVSVNELVDVPWLNSLMIGVYDTTVNAAAATIDTGAILPTSYALMRILLQARGDTAAAIASVGFRFNGDSAGNYNQETMNATNATLFGTGSGSSATSALFLGNIPANTAPLNAAGLVVVEIYNYANTTFFKTVVAQNSYESADTAAGQSWVGSSGIWKSTAAINRVTVLCGAGNLVTGSRLTIQMAGV